MRSMMCMAPPQSGQMRPDVDGVFVKRSPALKGGIFRLQSFIEEQSAARCDLGGAMTIGHAEAKVTDSDESRRAMCEEESWRMNSSGFSRMIFSAPFWR